ncbi:HAD family phosphatase [Acinetobacter sp.]|uniref:HAD family hydrolase n=1 Tax=Acinetobacter sp. TaxID=472 RepID=UPI000C51BECF|nr:HAD family phosphatase [Acinetobacter sp.]MBC69399.1 HAD family hydrolase [Acinetobacter sp.]
MNKNIKAVIFDLDGVLVEAKDWHYEALNMALKVFGCDFTYEEHLSTFDGLPTKTKLNMLHEMKNFPLELSQTVYELKQIYTHEFFSTRCFPDFSQDYLFRKLKKRKIKTAVASNSIRATVDQAMISLDIKKYIEFSLSNEDVKNPKPSPEIYSKSIEMLNLKPHECLIVEDNINGITAAKASGAHCLEVKEVEDVNHTNIFSFIDKLEEESL